MPRDVTILAAISIDSIYFSTKFNPSRPTKCHPALFATRPETRRQRYSVVLAVVTVSTVEKLVKPPTGKPTNVYVG